MSKTRILWLSVLFLNSCNTDAGKHIEYYSSGRIKRVINKPDDKGRGTTCEYYSNGVLESRFQWRKGQKDGLTEHFYLNGNREEVTEWKAGVAHGAYKQFHPNGQLKRQSFLSNGREEGPVLIYDLKGRINSKIIYNKDGKVIFAAKYKLDGSTEGTALFPLVSVQKDTITLGESVDLSIAFGYPLMGDNSMILGRGITRGIISDTIALVKPNENGLFRYSLKPQKIGLHRIWAIFKHAPPKQDTLSVDGIFYEFKFFVRKLK